MAALPKRFNPSMILIALASGTIAGVIMLLFSHLAPVFGAGNFVRDIDQPRLFRRTVTRREGHFVGILVHILLSAIFGGGYAYLAELGIFPGYHLLSILGWSVVLTVFVGGVLLPIEGHGIFGVKEDAWFPVDLFLTTIGWGVLFWWIVRLWVVAAP